MINVNTNDLRRLAVDLTTLHRSALPNTIRGTLNDLAFDVKKRTILTGVHNAGFTLRNSDSFFKKYSGIEKATGWEINSMKSHVGMIIPSNDAKFAVKGVGLQEDGGSIKHSDVPLSDARVGKSQQKRLQSKNYWNKIKIVAKIQYGDKQGLIRAVTKTRVQSEGESKGYGVVYGKYLYGIQGYKRLPATKKKDASIKLHLKRLYEYTPNKMVHLKPHHFLQKAQSESLKKASEFFTERAKYQIAKRTK
jgi:hypothetical protein